MSTAQPATPSPHAQPTADARPGVGAGAAAPHPHAVTPAEEKAILTMWERDLGVIAWRDPFNARLLHHLQPVVTREFPTAATDMVDTVYINPDFTKQLTTEERRGVWMHELHHCCRGHRRRVGHRDPTLWNLAADHEINDALTDAKIILPKGAILYQEHKGRCAEVVYADLEKELNKIRQQMGGSGSGTPGSSSSSGQPSKGQSGQGNNRGNVDHGITDEELRRLTRGQSSVDQHVQPKQMSADPQRDLERAEREWQRRVVVAAQQAERSATGVGSMPAWAKSMVDQIRRPEVPWETALAEHITFHGRGSEEEDWMRPNLRVMAVTERYFPSSRGTMLDGVVAVDSSGSTQPFLKRFWSEIHGIVATTDQYRLTVLSHDCGTTIRPEGVVTYDSTENPLPRAYGIPGGGGTDFRPIFKHIADTNSEPRFLVFFTDGEGPAPENPPGYPVLWVVPPGYKKPVNWGSQVTMRGTDNAATG